MLSLIQRYYSKKQNYLESPFMEKLFSSHTADGSLGLFPFSKLD